MKSKTNPLIYACLLLLWVAMLFLVQFAQAHLPEDSIVLSGLEGLKNLPVLVLIMVFLVGMYTRSRNRRAHKKQLMYLKSCIFRVELRELYTADFKALKSPSLTFAAIRRATLPELQDMRKAAEQVEYTSPEAIEGVIDEYVKAYDVWRSFMNMAKDKGFEDIFYDMLDVVHFVSDVEAFRMLSPGKMYAVEAANDDAEMARVLKILGDGIRKYLDYVIELKKEQPELFDHVVRDYELLAERTA